MTLKELTENLMTKCGGLGDTSDIGMTMREAARRLGQLRDMLDCAANQFATYEEEHLKKAEEAFKSSATVTYELECYRKAVVNKVWAARCRSASL